MPCSASPLCLRMSVLRILFAQVHLRQPETSRDRHGLSRSQLGAWIQLRLRAFQCLSLLAPSVEEQQQYSLEMTQFQQEMIKAGHPAKQHNDNGSWVNAAVVSVRANAVKRLGCL